MKPRILAFLLVLTLTPTAFIPAAAATPLSWFDWMVSQFSGAGTVGGHVSYDSVGNHRYVAWGETSGDDFYVASSEWEFDPNLPNNEPWSVWSTTQISGTLTGDANDLHAFSETLAVVCFVDPAGADVYFTRTGNGGTTWSPTTLVRSTNILRGCSIQALSTTTYIVAWHDDTIPAMQASITTDSGATWGTPFTIAASDLSTPTDHKMLVMRAKNATHLVVVYVQPTNQIASCYSTTGGGSGSWTCAVVGTATTVANTGIDLTHVIDNEFVFVYENDPDDYQFCSSTTLPTVWGCGPVGTVAFSRTASITGLGTAGSYGVFIGRDTGAIDATPLQYTQTVDSGGDWSTFEAAVTLSDGTDDGITTGDFSCESTCSLAGTGAGYNADTGEVMGALWYDRDAGGTGDGPQIVSTDAVVSAESVTVSAAATASVTALAGFDVDPTGSRIIARTTAGENVEVWGPNLGTSDSGVIDTNCAVSAEDREDAVMAMYGGDLVMFLNCRSSDGSPEFLSIRDINGAVPAAGDFGGCTPGSSSGQCPFNIGIEDWDQPFEDAVGQIGGLEDFPIDYSSRQGSGGTFTADILWGFITQAPDVGDIGIAWFGRYESASPDINGLDTEAYSSSLTEDFCVGVDDGEYYFAAVDAGQLARIWPIVINTNSEGRVTSASLGVSQGLSSAVSGSLGVACGGENILIQNDDGQVYLYNRQTNTLTLLATATDPTDRGVTMSRQFTANGAACDGGANCYQYGMFVDEATSEGIILNLTEGSIGDELCRITLPAGTFYDSQMTESGAQVFVGTIGSPGSIARYDLLTLCSVVIINPEIPDGDSIGDDDDLFDTTELGTALGVGAFGANLFMGAITIGIVSLGVATGPAALEKRLGFSPALAGVGAAVGFLLAWGFGFFSTAVVFSIVVLICAALGLWWWKK